MNWHFFDTLTPGEKTAPAAGANNRMYATLAHPSLSNLDVYFSHSVALDQRNPMLTVALSSKFGLRFDAKDNTKFNLNSDLSSRIKLNLVD